MKYNGARWLLLLAAVTVIVGLPLAGRFWRGEGTPRCAWDGLAVVPLYRVRVIDQGGAEREFCCIQCAERWLDRQPAGPKAVYVTDESSGAKIPAGSACFVRSTVITNPVTGNRVHAFGSRAGADEHCRAFSGTLVPDAERPFRNLP